MTRLLCLLLALTSLGCFRAREAVAAEDAPGGATDLRMFGGSIQRNLANAREKGVPDDFVTAKGKEKRVKWAVKLGSKAYGGPVVAEGKVFVGTNNKNPRDPKIKGDKGVLMCFDEADGKFLWQIVHDKLPGGATNDCPEEGVASTPAVDAGSVYYVSNRCELVRAAVADGKIEWKLDMVKDLEVFPCQLANSAPLVVGDLVCALTGHGVDIGDGKTPNEAPSLVAVNKKTGKVAWKYTIPAKDIIDGQWSSPSATTIDGKLQVLLAGGDGWLRGLDGEKGDLLWKFDCNPKKATPYKKGGSGEQSFLIGVPVIVDGKAIVGTGQEPDDGQGVGHLWCIDIAKKPANKDKDLSPVDDDWNPKSPKNKDSGLVWHYGGFVKGGARDYSFGRTIQTVAVHDGLVYASELAGFLHCLDLKTGAKVWEYDLQDGTWCSPYYVDGKVFLGIDGGDVFVFPAGRKAPKEPKKIEVGGQVKVPPVVANGVLYVNTGLYLYAIK